MYTHDIKDDNSGTLNNPDNYIKSMSWYVQGICKTINHLNTKLFLFITRIAFLNIQGLSHTDVIQNQFSFDNNFKLNATTFISLDRLIAKVIVTAAQQINLNTVL